MEWNRKYSLRSYLRSALWVVPVLAYVTSFIAIRIVGYLDDWLQWSWEWKMEVGTVQSVLQGLVAATISFIVFAFSSLLVAIQVASAQLTPRIIATTLLRDNTIRLVVALFVLTPELWPRHAGTIAGLTFSTCCSPVAVVLAGTSTVAFIYLIDYAARLLRPVSIVWRLGEEGLPVIEQVYPCEDQRKAHTVASRTRRWARRTGSSCITACPPSSWRSISRRCGSRPSAPTASSSSPARSAISSRWASRCSCCTAVPPRPTIECCGARLRFGPERTIEQDATFAFRVIVDIAIKALSKAINDPTTAVVAIDQLHRLLRVVGRRHLHDDVIMDGSGKPRVIFRTPGWDDFVQLSCREIRLYGAENYQVARRLRAMLENLVA